MNLNNEATIFSLNENLMFDVMKSFATKLINKEGKQVIFKTNKERRVKQNVNNPRTERKQKRHRTVRSLPCSRHVESLFRPRCVLGVRTGCPRDEQGSHVVQSPRRCRLQGDELPSRLRGECPGLIFTYLEDFKCKGTCPLCHVSLLVTAAL